MPATNTTDDWTFEATVANIDQVSQRIIWTFKHGSTLYTGFDSGAVNTGAGPVTVKMTGECADGADTINNNFWQVKLEALE